MVVVVIIGRCGGYFWVVVDFFLNFYGSIGGCGFVSVVVMDLLWV